MTPFDSRRLASIVASALCLLGSAGARAEAQQAQQAPVSPVAAVAPGATPPDASPVLHRGDVLRVTVWRKPELSGDFSVGPDGSLRHPLYREVQVEGVPVAEAAERLRAYLTRFEVAPQLVVEPLIRVTVVGEVRQPNLYTLSPELSIVEAIATAGGLTERGRIDRVRLRRGGTEWVLNLAGPHAVLADRRVESGDHITVDARRDVWREYVGPIASLAAAAVSIYNVASRRR